MNYLFLAKAIREPKYYETKVKSAVNTKSCVVADTQEEIDKALLCNLKLMKKALSKEQYGKYVALINVTRANMESKVSNPMLDSYLAEK